MFDRAVFCLQSSTGIALADDEVHVWLASLDQPLPVLARLWDAVAEHEWERATRLQVDVDRERFIAARAILKTLIGHYTAIAPQDVRFTYGPYGKPELDPAVASRPLRFNLSHCQGLALFAFTGNQDIGVDLEGLRPVPEADAIASEFFTPAQIEAMRAAAADHRQALFFTFWTEVEARLKALGLGLAGAEEHGRSALGGTVAPAQWTVRHFVPWPGYVATVAVGGTGCRFRFFEWTPGPTPV